MVDFIHYFFVKMFKALLTIATRSRVLVCSNLVSLALSLDCDSSQVYAKFMKKTINWASEESWQLLNGSTTVYSSPSLTNSETRTIETCLTATTNNQYILRMKDTANDSWSDGAWLEIYGVNGNLALKVMMTEGSTETMNLSLYALSTRTRSGSTTRMLMATGRM